MPFIFDESEIKMKLCLFKEDGRFKYEILLKLNSEAGLVNESKDIEE